MKTYPETFYFKEADLAWFMGATLCSIADKHLFHLFTKYLSKMNGCLIKV